MQLLIGLDIGTTAEKIALFDENGKVLASSLQEYSLLTPVENWIEVEPEVYWDSFKAGLKSIKEQYSLSEENKYALAISCQGETLLCVDEQGNNLRNAIVWMDNRAVYEAEALKKNFGDELCYMVTGQVSFEACWPASKILWIREHEAEVFAKTHMFALLEDYFIYRLTGIWVTEGSLVCSSTYWNIITKKYWTDVLDFIGIKETQLPRVMESGEIVGQILPMVAVELGIGKDLTVCTGCLDQVAGAIGIGNIKEGLFSENIGAALAIVCPVSKPVFDPYRRMPLHYFAQPDTYMIHTFTTGGITLRWFRDKLCHVEMTMEQLTGIDTYDTLSAEAARVPAGSDGLIMLPHLAGSLAPDVNTNAKGVWFGITLQHTKAHFIKSIMESLGYIIRRNIDALSDMGIQVSEIRSSGGGSKSVVWNQIKSDILGISIVTMRNNEAASLGAAILAGKAIGLFPTLDDATSKMVHEKDRFSPRKENKAVYDRGYKLYQKLLAALNECFTI